MSKRLFDEAAVIAHQARVGKPMGPLPERRTSPGRTAVDQDIDKGAQRKYRNEPVIDDDGIRHDSKREAKRWKELLMLQRAGQITWLARQVRFALPGQTTYIADFVYSVTLEIPGGAAVGVATVEDVKSPATRKTQAYRIKVRQMSAIHGIDVKEIL